MTYKADESSTRETLTKLATELEQKLLKIPIYREFLAVRKTLAELSGGPVKVSLERPSNAETPYRPVTVRLGRVTAISAAVMALNETGRPMSIHELVEAVTKRGFEFGGSSKSPPSALSAYFAKPGPKSPIVSIWVDNKPMWWFRDRPVPGAEVA